MNRRLIQLSSGKIYVKLPYFTNNECVILEYYHPDTYVISTPICKVKLHTDIICGDTWATDMSPSQLLTDDERQSIKKLATQAMIEYLAECKKQQSMQKAPAPQKGPCV